MKTRARAIIAHRSVIVDVFMLLVTVAIGLYGTLLVYRASCTAETNKRHERLAAIGRSVVDSFDLQLVRTMESVRATAAMVASHEKLEEREFARYGAHVIDEISVLSLLEWQPVVSAGQRKIFEATVVAQGHPGFRLREPQGAYFIAAGSRAEYVPIRYSWPENAEAMGVDMAFDPGRMLSKYKARDSGTPIASEPFSVIRSSAGGAQKLGFAISAPVYRNGAISTVAEKREKIQGYVAGVIEIPSLLRDAMFRASANGLDMIVVDVASTPRKLVFFGRGDVSDLPVVIDAAYPFQEFDEMLTVDVGSRPWEIILHPRPDYFVTEENHQAAIIRVAGTGATLVLALTLFWGQRSRRRTGVANHQLGAMASFSETILLDSPLPMGVYDEDGQCVNANQAYATLVGTSRETLLAQNFHHIKAWCVSGLRDDCVQVLLYAKASSREVNLTTAFGNPISIECRILRTTLNDRNHLLLQFIDFTERKKLEQELRSFAFQDTLTHLPNRRLLMDRLSQALLFSQRQQVYGAVVFLDLNKFKQLNDLHGHEIGDVYLMEVARRLIQVVRKTDTVARFGGDEFVLLLEGLGSTEDDVNRAVAELVAKIRLTLAIEFVHGEVRHQGSCSLGVRLFLGDVGSAEHILKDADFSMYQDKRK